MSIEGCLEKYLQLITSEAFAKYENDFASKLQRGLYEGYKKGMYEPQLVSVVEEVVNKFNGLSTSTNSFEISTKGIFIHGNKSQITFEYYGQPVQTELGDLIFILSIVYNGIKNFEKFTISQFKKDNKNLRWDLSNKEQLYLLSRFPTFKGVKGSLIPQREFNLPNYSGCLGSFNLLFRPGDFVFVSAPRLESFLNDRKSIHIDKRFYLWESPTYYLPYPIPYDWYDIKKLFYIWRKYWRDIWMEYWRDIWPKYWRHGFLFPFLPSFIGIFGSSHYASDVYDFTDKYLRGYIGELIYSFKSVYNRPALEFLNELLSAIRRKAQSEKKYEVIKFVDDFFGYPYGNSQERRIENENFNYEGGGLGIIYTLINLDKGE